ncbi:MAG: glycosyltransferase [Cytophagales bacterium]
MNQSPRVSVVLPVYNAEKYVSEAIYSILNQTFIDFELIILEDASTDNSLSVIQNFKDDRIILIKNEQNKGLVYNLNEGIRLASGEFIARMDADDIAMPERFKKQVKFLDENPDVDVLGTAFECFGEIEKVVVHPTSHHEIKKTLIEYCCVGHPTVMLRKKKLPKRYEVYKPELFTCEDYHLWVEMIKDRKFANLDEVLLKYRTHKQQVSSEKADKQMELNEYAKLKAFLPSVKFFEDNTISLLFSILNLEKQKLDWDRFYDLLQSLMFENNKSNYWEDEFFTQKLRTLCFQAFKKSINRDLKFFQRKALIKLLSWKEFAYWMRINYLAKK